MAWIGSIVRASTLSLSIMTLSQRSPFSPSPTLGAPRRGLFPGGDGETQCLKVRSEEVRDGPSLRSQAATGSCGLTLVTYFFLPSVCCNTAFHSSRLTAGSVVI